MTRMTIEGFRPIYEEWKASGLTIESNCKSVGFTRSRFYLSKGKLEAKSVPASSGSFIPVKMAGRPSSFDNYPSSGANALCEVAYPNGVVVRVTSDMTLDQLRQLVTLLR